MVKYAYICAYFQNMSLNPKYAIICAYNFLYSMSAKAYMHVSYHRDAPIEHVRLCTYLHLYTFICDVSALQITLKSESEKLQYVKDAGSE